MPPPAWLCGVLKCKILTYPLQSLGVPNIEFQSLELQGVARSLFGADNLARREALAFLGFKMQGLAFKALRPVFSYVRHGLAPKR